MAEAGDKKKDIIIVTGGVVDDILLMDIIESTSDKPYIIGVDKGMEALERLQITADLIVGDFDSADESIKEKYAMDKRTILLNPIKDMTDTHVAVKKAVDYAESKNISIIIMGATGGRIDHLLGNIGLLKHCLLYDVKACIVDRQNKISMLDKDAVIKKKDLYGKFISLIPFTDMVEGVTLEGFKYNLSDGVLLKGDTLGISNELIKEEGRISIKSGILLLLETKD
ncbi:MAG: thiamine diphosphokinase [Lachnospiraceae bacterium]|nr:thiamine diphosphokinase [Lachnospiraceae bacterium]